MATGKPFKYNPQTDVVADRTASQIMAAKRKAVGGKKKRCVKGKSCSATCIASNKVCLVEIPWVAAKGIGKVRDSLLKGKTPVKQISQESQKQTKFPAALKVSPDDREDVKSLKENYNATRKIILSEIKKDGSLDSDGRMAMVMAAKRKMIQGEGAPILNKIHEERKAEGKEFEQVNMKLLSAERLLREKVFLSEMIKKKLNNMPGSTPEDKAARDKMQKFLDETKELNKFLFGEVKKVLAEKKAIKDSLKPVTTGKAPKSVTQLPKISTEGEYVKAKQDSALAKNTEAKAFHDRLKGILNPSSDPNGKYKDERDGIQTAVGGITNFYKGVAALRDFTDEDSYAEFRRVQRKDAAGKALSRQERKTLEKVKDAERLLAALPKEEVVKFRGVPASDEKLSAILQAARTKGLHAEGALASWSTSLKTAEGFADKADEYDLPHRIIYRTVNKQGSSVKGVSHFEGEDEIVTGGSVKYRHTGNYEVIQDGYGNEYHVIDIEELSG